MNIDIDVGAWGATLLAIGGAGVAVWQAFSAKSQAQSAKEQAIAARESAATAERQATAAEDHLALARLQFQSELDARDEADGPEFEVTTGMVHVHDEQYAEVPIKLLSGKPLASVVISVAGQPNVRGFVNRVAGGWDGMRAAVTRTDLAPGAAFTVVLMLKYEASTPLNVRLDFECHEGDGGPRTWHRSYSSQVSRPPEPATESRSLRRLPFDGR
ncbi:hypothetical protein [Micromonospora sp. NPDC085948]|uniref:hypothetical protein n=1 Tax=Micromonospora sp. NPDC085948 TaxID=3155293 RepID=UPI0034390529